MTLQNRTALAVSTVALVGLLAGHTAHADYASTVLADGPAAYFRLNDNAVTPPPPVATNLGSLGATGNGAYSGSYLKPVEGAMAGDTAVGFSNPGSTTVAYVGSVNVPNHPALNPSGGFTIEFWVKPNGTVSSLLSPVNSMSFTTGRSGYLFYQNGATWQFRIGVTTSTTASVLNGGAVLANQWQHIVGVYSGGPSGTMTLYVDGVAVGSAAATYEVNDNAPFCIGATSAPNRTFDGSVDEVVFYSAVLGADIIAAHHAARTTNAANYASQILAAAPVGYWRLNEPADPVTVAVNSGSLGSANNGIYRYWSANTTDLTGPAYPGFSATNTVLQTSGTNGLVAIPALNLNANQVTMECWIKRNGPQSSYAGVLFHRGSAGGTATGIDFVGTSDTLGYHWNDQADTYNWSSGLIPPDGEWAYVALAVSPEQATMYMYDGITWSTAINAVSHPVQAFADITRIGADQDAARFFNGLIDEAAIYGKTLTEGQLRTHALAGFGDPAMNPPTFVTDPPVLSPSGIIYSTTPFELTADAYGEPPLTFQWRLEGTNLPGATQRVFSRAAATAADAGNYAVVVGNAYGFVTSSVVTVTINPAVPPTIDVQPVARQVYPGGTARFAVVASGTQPLTYQWRRSGTILPGATNATLVLPNCTAAETGNYQVSVFNVASPGGVNSSTVTLSLRTPAANTYESLAAGMRPLAYWRLGETSGTTAYDYAGGNDGTYNNVTQGTAGAVSGDANACGSFDGFTSFVGTSPLLNGLTNFTLAGWVRRAGPQLARTGLFGQNDNFEFGYISDATIQAWDSVPGNNLDVANPFADGEWGFVVVTTDTASRTIYINGQVAARGGGRSNSVTNNFNFNIGGGGIFDGTGNYFAGDLDEVALFDRVLTVQEVCALYLKGSGYAGEFEPTFSLISGTGQQGLANVNFSAGDGGFTVETPGGSFEAPWIYDGSSWWSAGENTGFGNDNASYLISPIHTVTKSGTLKLTFSHRYSFERDTVNWDGGAVEVSINGGPWTYVPAVQFDQNGYTGVVESAPALSGKQAFIGNSAGHPAYITSSCWLTGANAGDSVSVRFVAAYDYGATGNLNPPGWQIASVQLLEGIGGTALVTCPCGSLERKQGDLGSGTWVDLGSGSAVISTTQTNQQYFRIAR